MVCVYTHTHTHTHIYIIIHLSKHKEHTTPRVNAKVNHGPWAMMDQCRFTKCNKFITLVGHVNNKLWGGGGIWEISVLSAQFCCSPKTALKIKSTKNKEEALFLTFIIQCVNSHYKHHLELVSASSWVPSQTYSESLESVLKSIPPSKGF